MIFKKLLTSWTKHGLYLPFAHDPTTNQPSVTLLFFYIGFSLAAGYTAASSTLMILKGDYLTATIMPTLLAFMGFVFYRLRHLDRVKLDLDKKQIELSSNEDAGKDEPK